MVEQLLVAVPRALGQQQSASGMLLDRDHQSSRDAVVSSSGKSGGRASPTQFALRDIHS